MLVRTHHVPLRETMLWVEARIPKSSARILEVGCGEGHVAAALVGAGHQVVAIDANEAAVTAARYKGVDARVGEFPNCDPAVDTDGPFDIVLFTRSLHHIHQLDAACEAAFSMLAPGGSVLVEDWSWNIIDERTAAWAYGLMGVGRAAGIVPSDLWQESNDPLTAWLSEHRDHVHEVATMRDAIQKCTTSSSHSFALDEEAAPYFYRYFATYTSEKDSGTQITESVLAAERQMLQTRAMAPLGWRLSAVRTS